MTDLQKIVRRFTGGGAVAAVRDAYAVWQGADYDSVALHVSAEPELVIRRVTVHGLAEIEERSPTTEELAHLTEWITARLPERSWWKSDIIRIASKELRDKLRTDGDITDLFFAASEPISETRVIAFLGQAVAKGTITQAEMDDLLTDLRSAFDGN